MITTSMILCSLFAVQIPVGGGGGYNPNCQNDTLVWSSEAYVGQATGTTYYIPSAPHPYRAKYEQMEFDLICQDTTACPPTGVCDKNLTATFNEYTYKIQNTVKRTSSVGVKTGLIPLFLLLTGTEFEVKNGVEETTTEEQSLKIPQATASYGQRRDYFRPTTIRREEERVKHPNNNDNAMRTRTEKIRGSAVGGWGFSPQTYNKCKGMFEGPYCNQPPQGGGATSTQACMIDGEGSL